MEPNKIMAGPEVQTPSRNFHKQELILTRIIWQLHTPKPVKTPKLEYHTFLEKHYITLGGCNCTKCRPS